MRGQAARPQAFGDARGRPWSQLAPPPFFPHLLHIPRSPVSAPYSSIQDPRSLIPDPCSRIPALCPDSRPVVRRRCVQILSLAAVLWTGTFSSPSLLGGASGLPKLISPALLNPRDRPTTLHRSEPGAGTGRKRLTYWAGLGGRCSSHTSGSNQAGIRGLFLQPLLDDCAGYLPFGPYHQPKLREGTLKSTGLLLLISPVGMEESSRPLL